MKMTAQHTIREIFTSSYVLGGSPCSGKSTLAERLSRAYNLPYYKVDDHIWRHLEQADPRTHPTMAVYGARSWDEIWSQPVDAQVRDVFAYYTEQFPMVLDDLLGYRDQGPIIMEGAAFLPALVGEWGATPDHTVFLVPSKAFQIEHYSQRSWVTPILDSCADPDQAFANWMERDHRFGQEISEQAAVCGYPTILVDGQKSVDELYIQVIELFNLQSKMVAF